MTHTLVSTAGKAIDLGADLADKLYEIAQQPDLMPALAEALAHAERATGNNAADMIFAWRNDSRRQVERHLGVDHRSASRTARHIVYLVAAITRRAGNLACFIARWRKLDRLEVPALPPIQCRHQLPTHLCRSIETPGTLAYDTIGMFVAFTQQKNIASDIRCTP